MAKIARERVATDALLLRATPLRDADLVVTLYTEAQGAVSAVARGARKSRRRFQGLEPMHVLHATLELSRGRALGTLTEVILQRPRIGLTGNLAAMNAAGRALRWLRRTAPERTGEPDMWALINGLLDDLDRGGRDADARLAEAGLQMLVVSGWGLELGSCVRCGKVAPPRARTFIDVRAGGVVCRTCGGHGPEIGSKVRASIEAAAAGAPLPPEHAGVVLDLVDDAFEAHARGEAT